MREEIIGDCRLILADCMDVLPTLGKVDAVVTDLALGVAGEHFFCADLLLQGYNAFLTDQNCPYDVALEIGGRLIRVQVKTTRKERHIPQRAVRTPAYLFHVRRCGKGGRRSYNETDFDVMALVALDIRKIAYIKLSEAKQTIHLNREKFLSFSDVKRAL